jgi:hypothetical protein
MFTIEMEDTTTTIVSLDESGLHDDITFTLCDDDTVHISQYCEEFGEEQIMLISYQQLLDVVSSLGQPVGAYYQKTHP